MRKLASWSWSGLGSAGLRSGQQVPSIQTRTAHSPGCLQVARGFAYTVLPYLNEEHGVQLITQVLRIQGTKQEGV